MLPFLRKREEKMAQNVAMTTDRRNIPFLQKIADFNSGDAISAAVLFSSVRPIAAYTLRRGPQRVAK